MSNRLAKLVRMSPEELGSRLRQHLTTRADLARCSVGLPPQPRLRDAADVEAGSFFFDADEIDGLIDCLRRRLPSVADRIVDRAERACAGHFDLLGYRDLAFGRPPDWHLDAASGTVAARRPAHKIRYLDYAEVGDAKVTWELNRHQHLVVLAKAHRITGEARFVDEIRVQLEDWWLQNPYPRGINWASALEVAFRSASWLWLEQLLARTGALPADLATRLRRALALNARHLERHLSTYFSPNTHLLGEAFALFMVGLLLPEAADSGRWRDKGWRVLVEEAARQVRADGLHFERSVYYHVYALDFFLHARILAERNGLARHAQLDPVIVRQLEALRLLAGSGTPFTFGDDDGGRLFEGARNRAAPLADPLSTGAALYGRADLKTDTDPPEETLWLLGRDAIERLDGLEARPVAPGSHVLPESGIYILRGAAPSPYDVMVAAGPFGGPAGGHGHADLLSLQVRVGGEIIAGDSGTYVYVAPDDSRLRFRQTRAHNTVQVDGRSQAEPVGPFSWAALPSAATERWIGTPAFDLFHGSHPGYRDAMHSRWVWHLRSRFVLVRDRVDGSGDATAELRWHFEPGTLLEAPAGGAVVAAGAEGGRMALLTAAEQPWRMALEDGVASPAYGLALRRPVMRLSAAGALPLEAATVLVPLGEPASTPETLAHAAAADDGRGTVSRYELRTPEAVYTVFFANRPGAWEDSDWESDAGFLYCRMDRHHRHITELAIVGGTHVRHGERVWQPPPETAEHWTWADPTAVDPSR